KVCKHPSPPVTDPRNSRSQRKDHRSPAPGPPVGAARDTCSTATDTCSPSTTHSPTTGHHTRGATTWLPPTSRGCATTRTGTRHAQSERNSTRSSSAEPNNSRRKASEQQQHQPPRRGTNH